VTIAESKLSDGCTALEWVLLSKSMDMALLLMEKGSNPWAHGGPFVSAVHLATHMDSSPNNPLNLELFLEKAMLTPVDPTPQATLSFIQLALDIGNSQIWNKFQDFTKRVQSMRDSDGWTIKDFSSQANYPFGIIETNEEPVPHEFLRPSALVVPKAWSIDAGDVGLMYKISPTGLEIEASSKLEPLHTRSSSWHLLSASRSKVQSVVPSR